MNYYRDLTQIPLNRFGLKEKKHMMFQLLSAVHYLHEKKILHRVTASPLEKAK